MAASTIEVLLKFTGDPRNAKDAIAQVRADLTKSVQQQVNTARQVNKQVASEAKQQTKALEAEERARTRVAESLQRQRSAALIAQWKLELREKQKIEKEKERAEKGGSDFTVLLNSVPVLRGVTTQLSSLTEAAGASTTAIAGVAGAIGIMAAGAAVGIGVLVKLGEEIFDLTKKTAEFQGKFFDLSQQVGVSVETLSTLDVIASTTGGNIDTVTASLGIFQKNLEEAHDPTSKQAKLLKDLGVTSLDTEVALRQTLLGLFKLGEGSKQTADTLLLFGRGGRFVNAILKESHGNLDETTERLRRLGLQVSSADALIADQFNDSLGILNRQFQAITIQLTSQVIPVFINLFQEISIGLTGNKDSWANWGEVIEAEVAGVIATIKTLVQFIASRGTLDPFVLFDANFTGILEQARKLRAELSAQAGVDLNARIVAGFGTGRPGDRPDPDKARKDAATRADKALRLEQQAVEERIRAHQQNLESEREKELKNIDEWANAAKELAEEHNRSQKALLDEEEANARKFVKGAEDRQLALNEIALKRLKATNQLVEELEKIDDQAQKRRDDLSLKQVERLFEQTEAERQGRLEALKRSGASESEIFRQQQEALTQQHAERVAILNEELGAISTTASRQEAIRDKLKVVETEYTNEFLRLSSERMAALAREAAAQTPAPGGGRQVPVEPLPKIIFDDSTLGKVPEALGEWAIAIETVKDGWRQLQEEMRSFGAFAGGAIIDTLHGVAGAIADSVAVWALYGKSFGEAMRQGLAAVAARVAGEAAFRGALHAAYAIGSLALGDFRSAGLHALAAAKFFALAAATGVAARAIAGNSFQKNTGGSSGGRGTGGGNNSSNTSAPTNPKPVEFDRNVRNQQQIVTVLVNVTRDPGSIVEAVVLDARSGGPIRQLIQTEMAS